MYPSKGQSSGEVNDESCVFVKNLPYFSTSDSLDRYFARFGKVVDVSLIHKLGEYLRCARVKMKDAHEAQNVLFSVNPHTIDGKEVQVMPFQGMDTHLQEFVKGAFYVHFKDLFEVDLSRKIVRAINEAQVEEAWKKLDDAFQPFEYTNIVFEYKRLGPKLKGCYNGHAVVSFKDDEKKNKIMETTMEKFQNNFNHFSYKRIKVKHISLG